METEINIVEILKDKPANTKLYSPLFSEVFFSHVSGGYIAVEHHGGTSLFLSSGRFYDYDGSEPLLFPSKEMRDWSKFAWKKGDVLVNKDGDVHIIFERFVDGTYCSFVGKYYLWKENNDTEHFYKNERLLTSDFQKAGKDAAQTYISNIEERLFGKLNRETLEIEKNQPEFKDGDVVALDTRYIDSNDVIVESFIVRGDYKYGDDLKFYAACSNNKETDVVYNSSIMINKTSVRKESLRLSTEEEKQQLFSALAKEGKAWDAEKKQFVELKPKIEFKPFDKVVVRDTEYSTWCADLFSHIDEDYRYACVGATWNFCIPYNEETAKLIGTTNNVEG